MFIPKAVISNKISLSKFIDVLNDMDKCYITDRICEFINSSTLELESVYIIDAFTMAYILSVDEYIDKHGKEFVFKEISYMFKQDSILYMSTLFFKFIYTNEDKFSNNMIKALQILCSFELYKYENDVITFLNKCYKLIEDMNNNECMIYSDTDYKIYLMMALSKYKVTKFEYIVNNLKSFCNFNPNSFMMIFNKDEILSNGPGYNKNKLNISSLTNSIIVLLSFNQNIHRSIIKRYNIQANDRSELLLKMYSSVTMESFVEPCGLWHETLNNIAYKNEKFSYDAYECIKMKSSSIWNIFKDAIELINFYSDLSQKGNLIQYNMHIISSVSIHYILFILYKIQYINNNIINEMSTAIENNTRFTFSDSYIRHMTLNMKDYLKNAMDLQDIILKIKENKIHNILKLIPKSTWINAYTIKNLNDIINNLNDDYSDEGILKSIASKYKFDIEDLNILYHGGFTIIQNNSTIDSIHESHEFVNSVIRRENKRLGLPESTKRISIENMKGNNKSISILSTNKVFKSNNIKMLIVKPDSMIHGFAGIITGCCQEYASEGRECCITAASKYSSTTALFYEDGVIKAISFMHYDPQGILCLDTIEHKGDVTLGPEVSDYIKCTIDYMKYMESEYNLVMHSLAIGSGYGAFRGNACLDEVENIIHKFNKSDMHYISHLISYLNIYRFYDEIQMAKSVFLYIFSRVENRNNRNIEYTSDYTINCKPTITEYDKGFNDIFYFLNCGYSDFNKNQIVYVDEESYNKFKCNKIPSVARRLLHIVYSSIDINADNISLDKLIKSYMRFLSPIRDILCVATSNSNNLYRFINCINNLSSCESYDDELKPMVLDLFEYLEKLIKIIDKDGIDKLNVVDYSNIIKDILSEYNLPNEKGSNIKFKTSLKDLINADGIISDDDDGDNGDEDADEGPIEEDCVEYSHIRNETNLNNITFGGEYAISSYTSQPSDEMEGVDWDDDDDDDDEDC